jgi:ribonuclease PH
MTGAGELVEVQATAEGDPFPRSSLDDLLDLSERGIRLLTAKQQEAVAAEPS